MILLKVVKIYYHECIFFKLMFLIEYTIKKKKKVIFVKIINKFYVKKKDKSFHFYFNNDKQFYIKYFPK